MRLRPVAVALVLLAALTGCSGGSAKTATPTPTVSPTPVVDIAAETAQITKAWESFFTPAGGVDAHIGLLENGAAFRAELTASSKDPTAANLSSKVTKVVVTGLTAAVTYNLLGKGGAALLTGAVGGAVKENGIWKVSKLTYCQLINLQNPKVKHPACL